MKKYYIFMRYIILIFAAFNFGSLQARGQQLAFPGAEGAGRFTSGGRGGVVYEVTNLDNSGPGSFRQGVEMSGARTIVFKVSGNIELASDIRIRNGNLTIAGQTAPGDGITLKGAGVVVEANNIIIRYIRFRPGDISGRELDAIWGRDQSDIIIDHCSMSWATDETASFYDNDNFTIQYCILSESLYESVHGKGRHGYGGIWGGRKASFHHNLLAHHSSRNPRFNGARYNTTPETEIVDFRNNVIYNWGSGNSAYGGEKGNHNIVNNYYKSGPALTSGEKRYRIVNPTLSDPKGKYYVEGNFVAGFPAITADNWSGGVQPASNAVRMNEPFNVVPLETQHTAEEAYESVLAEAGASYPRRDPVDRRIIQETATGTATYGGAYGAERGIIDTQETVGGWPELQSAPAPVDSDNDGMPDAWEEANGLDPNNTADRNMDINGDGYTNLENYLNELLLTEPADFLRPPFGFATGNITRTSIELRWEATEETETEQLILERAGSEGDFAVVATLGGNTQNYTDEELESGTIYQYRLKAESATESSTYTNIISATTLPSPAEPGLEGLAGYWSFNESAGKVVTDQSSFANNGVVSGNEHARTQGISGNAIDFSGVAAEDHIEIPAGDQLKFDDNSFSVSVWIKGSTDALPAYIFHKGTFARNTTTGATGKWFGLELKDELIRFAVDDDVTKSEVSADNADVLADEWVHVVAVRDRDTKTLRLYVNGRLIQEQRDNTVSAIGSDEPLIVGNSSDLDVPFRGELDELRIYNYSLSAGEIAGLHQGPAFKATNPSPASGTADMNPEEEVVLSWNEREAVTYNLYFGTDPEALELIAENREDAGFAVTDEVAAGEEYFWRVDAVAEPGFTVRGDIWSFTMAEETITGLEDLQIVEEFKCYPNPFRDQLEVKITLLKEERVVLSLYDMSNRLVHTFINSSLSPGAYRVGLDTRKYNLAEGIYFCILKTPEGKSVRKVIYLK